MSEYIRGDFEPDFVMMLVDVFGEVCAHVEAASGEKPSEDVRNALAKAIMALAENGETDPAALKAHALASLQHSVGNSGRISLISHS